MLLSDDSVLAVLAALALGKGCRKSSQNSLVEATNTSENYSHTPEPIATVYMLHARACIFCNNGVVCKDGAHCGSVTEEKD